MGLLFNKKKSIKFNFLELLPVGTIVKIKNNERKHMITSYMDDGSYIVYNYPLGNTFSEDSDIICIHDEDIEKIIFKGYESKERNEFLNLMNSINGYGNEK